MNAIQEAQVDFYERSLPSDRFLDYVHHYKLDLRRIQRFAGHCAVLNIIDCGNRRFDFAGKHSEGIEAFVIETFDVDDETIVDLVAWPLKNPKAPMTLFGKCGLLGLAHAFNPATFIFEKPLNVHRTPLRWLRSGCEGACVVEPRLAAWQLLDVPGRIAGEDREHTRELLNLAESVIDRKRFVAPQTDIRRAA